MCPSIVLEPWGCPYWNHGGLYTEIMGGVHTRIMGCPYWNHGVSILESWGVHTGIMGCPSWKHVDVVPILESWGCCSHTGIIGVSILES